MTNKMTVELQRSPTPRELADRMQLSVEDVLESRAARRAYQPDSLDAPPKPADDDSPRTWDTLYGSEDEGYARVEANALVERAMRALPEREQQIIRLRFGAELSQAEIGEALGISQMHVSRLLRRSLDRVGAIARV
jgi:RNA polymerase sigma-B factor